MALQNRKILTKQASSIYRNPPYKSEVSLAKQTISLLPSLSRFTFQSFPLAVNLTGPFHC